MYTLHDTVVLNNIPLIPVMSTNTTKATSQVLQKPSEPYFYMVKVVTQEELDKWFDGVSFNERMEAIRPKGGFVLSQLLDGQVTYRTFQRIAALPSLK